MNEIDLNQSGIYEIVSPSGKRYVGSAVCFRNRWAIHQHHLSKGKHHCRALQRAFNKYEAALDYRVIELCPKEQLLVREQFHIDASDKVSLYNSALTAGSPLGVVRSAETRAKLRALNVGKALSEETRARMGAARRGVPLSAETRARMCAAQAGKVVSSRARRNMCVKKSTNTSGYVGVSFNRPSGKWAAQRRFGKKLVHLGLFPTAELAHEARSNFDKILDYYSHS